ncbi:MAG: helix-turn-helix transcriptional regulator [Ruminococcaceae bacterium]|nr:helix-turn-helix transcriptional regulator [Oscillospiraceae bacterium]
MLPVTHCGYKIDTVDQNGVSPHTHTVTSEIIQTFDNHGSLMIDGKLYNMKKNGLYFIYGRAIHFVIPEDINRYNHSIMLLNTAETARLFKNLDMSDVFGRIFTQNGGLFCELSPEAVIEADSVFLNVKNILADDKLQYARLAAELVRLSQIGLKYAETDKKSGDKISDIISYISDNAFKKVTIDDICKELHISKYHLCRIFKENTGVTIGDFIKNRRLSVAKQLLADTDLKITEIAQRCCFSDNSFFTKTFSLEFGVTPTEYRAKYR